MTKEEIKFQCLRVVQEINFSLRDLSMASTVAQAPRKNTEETIIDAQKVYDWIKEE